MLVATGAVGHLDQRVIQHALLMGAEGQLWRLHTVHAGAYHRGQLVVPQSADEARRWHAWPRQGYTGDAGDLVPYTGGPLSQIEARHGLERLDAALARCVPVMDRGIRQLAEAAEENRTRLAALEARTRPLAR